MGFQILLLAVADGEMQEGEQLGDDFSGPGEKQYGLGQDKGSSAGEEPTDLRPAKKKESTGLRSRLECGDRDRDAVQVT